MKLPWKQTKGLTETPLTGIVESMEPVDHYATRSLEIAAETEEDAIAEAKRRLQEGFTAEGFAVLDMDVIKVEKV